MSKFISTAKSIVLNNWALKTLALILALITYQSIKDAISFEVPFEVPVEVKVEEGIAILDQNPRTVEVTLQGSRDDLRQLSQSQMRVLLKPKATDPDGSEVITIRPGDIDGASGARVVSIKPKDVTLTFDRESEKKVSITKPKVRGAPLVGKIELDYEPKTATIKGPKRRINEKSFLETEPVDVDGRVQSFTKRVRIIPPADAMVTKIVPNEVEVTVSIVTDTVSREWTNVQVTAMTPPGMLSTITIDPAVVNIQLHGRKDLIEKVDDKVLTAFANCMAVSPGSSKQLPVNVYMPFGPDLTATVSPETVTVTVSEPPKHPKPETTEVE